MERRLTQKVRHQRRKNQWLMEPWPRVRSTSRSCSYPAPIRMETMIFSRRLWSTITTSHNPLRKSTTAEQLTAMVLQFTCSSLASSSELLLHSDHGPWSVVVAIFDWTTGLVHLPLSIEFGWWHLTLYILIHHYSLDAAVAISWVFCGSSAYWFVIRLRWIACVCTHNVNMLVPVICMCWTVVLWKLLLETQFRYNTVNCCCWCCIELTLILSIVYCLMRPCNTFDHFYVVYLLTLGLFWYKSYILYNLPV